MSVVRPVRNPAIPGTPADRTGTAGILRRARADIRKRYAVVLREVLAGFDRIPVFAINDLRGLEVRYGVTLAALSGIAEELQAALARWLGSDGRSSEHVFWWDRYVDESSQLGTAQSVANLTNLSSTYAASRTLAEVLYSEPYRTRIATAKFKSYEHWTGLAAQERAELAQIIGQAVADGINPRAARAMIRDRLDVSMSKALAYAQSDITDTLRMARAAESDAAEAELGIKTGLLWTSALLPTTRPWHASRSGKVYTSSEVRAFYADGGNRYRCHCSTTECLLDANGKPILTKKLQATMANEKKAWQSRYASP